MSSTETAGTVCEVWHLDEDGHPTRFLGYGSLVSAQVLVLHPPAGRSRHPRTGRARVRVRRAGALEVLDGSLEPAHVAGLRSLRAVSLDGPSRGEVADLPWPRRGHPDTVGAFRSALATLAGGDPAEEPSEPPATPDAPGPPVPDNTQIRPPWCWMFPSCPGC
jgi:hypothetical protein